jgi:hypothetical protein
MRGAIVRFMFFKSPSERFYSPFYLTPPQTLLDSPNPTTITIYNATRYGMNDWKFAYTGPSSTSRSQNVDYVINSITEFLWSQRQTDLEFRFPKLRRQKQGYFYV